MDYGAACTPGSWVGQIVTFFAYRPPSRPLGSLTPTQPGRVTNPTQGHPESPPGKPLRQSTARAVESVKASAPLQTAARRPCVVVVVVAATPNYLRQASQNLGKYVCG